MRTKRLSVRVCEQKKSKQIQRDMPHFLAYHADFFRNSYFRAVPATKIWAISGAEKENSGMDFFMVQ